MYYMRRLSISFSEDLGNLKILKNLRRLYRDIFVKMNSVFFCHKELVLISIDFVLFLYLIQV